MASKLLHVGCLIVIGAAGCASSTRNAVDNVGLGMTTEEVRTIVGAPTAQAEQETYQAWRYEYRVVGPCAYKDGRGSECRQLCEHATLWFNDNEFRSTTRIRVESLEECGESSTPIFWEHMPDYAKGPNG